MKRHVQRLAVANSDAAKDRPFRGLTRNPPHGLAVETHAEARYPPNPKCTGSSAGLRRRAPRRAEGGEDARLVVRVPRVCEAPRLRRKHYVERIAPPEPSEKLVRASTTAVESTNPTCAESSAGWQLVNPRWRNVSGSAVYAARCREALVARAGGGRTGFRASPPQRAFSGSTNNGCSLSQRRRPFAASVAISIWSRPPSQVRLQTRGTRRRA